MSAPVPPGRWIRQGCPLSGQLYSLMIEPLLQRLTKYLKGVLIQNGSESVKLILSADADDITVFITRQDDFRSLNENIKLMKTAKINWDKSEGYNMGQWDEVGYPKLPGGLRWGRVKSCRCFYR